MAIRITGMNSGLDTESIISELVKAKSTKKDDLVKAQTKLQWKQDAWKELNTKVYALYSKTLSNMRLASDYVKKTTKVSNANAVSVITGANAVNGVQTVKVNQLAKTGYLTGKELKKDGKKAEYTSSTKLTDMGVEEGSELELRVDGKTTKITVDGDMTVNDFVKTLKNAGLNANFDEKNQRFFLSSKTTGKDSDFSLVAKDTKGNGALQALGVACGLTEAEKEYYGSFCTKAGDGKYTAKTVQEADVEERIKKAVEEYKTKYETAKNDLTATAEAIEKVKADYSLGDDDLSDPDAKINEIEEKLKNAEEEGSALTKDDIDILESKLKGLKEYQELTAKETELKAEVADIETKCDIGEEWTAKDSLKRSIVEEEQAKYDAAAFALNNQVKSDGATRIEGANAIIELNGAVFETSGNTFEINGLTITANMVTTEEFTITTADDTDGIYDMIKNFFKEYNTLINEMDKLYNADSSKGYEPLTDEEKDAMSEKEIEKWEEKIKDSILRRDSTLSTVSSAMKQVMLQGIEMKNGSKMYLSDFGIGTLGYFSSADNEKNAYHIDGDPDDTNTMSNADKLKTAIANDPDTVIEFFSSLSKNLYEKLGDLMKKTDYSSSFTLYDDVAMKDEYNDYTTKISEQEEKITAFEDRYYKKFSAMEVALSKLQSKESALSGLFGG